MLRLATVTCLGCDAFFNVKASKLAHGRGKYCSKTCAHENTPKGENHGNWRGGQEVRTSCKTCGIEFIGKKCNPNTFCSRACQTGVNAPLYIHGLSYTPEYQRNTVEIRRARKAQTGGSFTQDDIEKLFEMQEGLCAYCEKSLNRYHIDHVLPLSLGGSSNPSNLALACVSCNLSKATKLPLNFLWRS